MLLTQHHAPVSNFIIDLSLVELRRPLAGVGKGLTEQEGQNINAVFERLIVFYLREAHIPAGRCLSPRRKPTMSTHKLQCLIRSEQNSRGVFEFAENSSIASTSSPDLRSDSITC